MTLVSSSFAAGSFRSIVSSAWAGDATHQGASGYFGFKGNDGITLGGTLFFGTISGGAGAALTGGNFWQGAVTGLVVSGLNHVMHGGFAKRDSEVDVLLDTEGASGHGHTAMLAGNDKKGWRFVSKEGRAADNSSDGQDGNILTGGKSAVLDISYATKAEALSNHPLYDRVMSFKTTYGNAMRAINATCKVSLHC